MAIPTVSPILIVEDDPDDAMLALRALRRARVHNDMILVTDGVEALEYLFRTGPWSTHRIAPPPGLVILDLRLPRIDGIEVLRRVRADERTRHIPVMILTSDPSTRHQVEAAALGIHAFARKPLQFPELAEALRALNMSVVLTGPLTDMALLAS